MHSAWNSIYPSTEEDLYQINWLVTDQCLPCKVRPTDLVSSSELNWVVIIPNSQSHIGPVITLNFVSAINQLCTGLHWIRVSSHNFSSCRYLSIIFFSVNLNATNTSEQWAQSFQRCHIKHPDINTKPRSACICYYPIPKYLKFQSKSIT